jgi:hypothetical protein
MLQIMQYINTQNSYPYSTILPDISYLYHVTFLVIIHDISGATSSKVIFTFPFLFVMFQPDGKSIVAKLLLKYPPEVDALQLQKILKAHWKGKILWKQPF